MHTSETKFNFTSPCNSIAAQFQLLRAEQKAPADRTGMHGLQSWTDLRVGGGRRCARAADKLHKEGPVLKSEEEEAVAAAAGARERRNGMWTSGEPSGEGEGYERKK